MGETSRQLNEKEGKLRESGCIYIDLLNIQDRFKAISKSDFDWLDEINRRSAVSKKSKKQKLDKCASLGCCITKYDSNVSWVECSKCVPWMHYVCDGISGLEMELLSGEYLCVSCRGFTSSVEFIQHKLSGQKEDQVSFRS